VGSENFHADVLFNENWEAPFLYFQSLFGKHGIGILLEL
jgi:hypothetical protein